MKGTERILNWQQLSDGDIFLYAQSFRRRAAAMFDAVDLEASPLATFDAASVIFLYRYAVELSLKALVLGEGGNFVDREEDRLSVYKTHSLSWLGQFASQIVKAVGWEAEFHCEGIANLTEFKKFMGELNESDPLASYACRIPVAADPASLAVAVREFARRTEALLNLLERTADGLAVEWDLRSDRSDEFPPTVH
jgi:hypothetical protein